MIILNLGNYILLGNKGRVTHSVIQMYLQVLFKVLFYGYGLYLCEEWSTFLGLLLANCKVALGVQLHILYVFIFQKVIVMTPLVSLPAYLTSHFSTVYVKLSQTISFYRVTLLFYWWKQQPFRDYSDTSYNAVFVGMVGLKNLPMELHFVRYVHLWCLYDGVKL